MAEQSVDLRSALSIWRRRRRTLLAAALLGAAVGVGSVLLWPPMYTSNSLVLLPRAQDASGQAITRDVKTEIQIATSDAVLGPAGDDLSPPMSLRTLVRRVEVSAPSTDVLRIEARAGSPRLAESISRAVAQSEVTYATEAANSLTSSQKAALDKRSRRLQTTLETLNDEIEKSTARKQELDPNTAEGKAEATALAQLTAQQANVVYQIDRLEDETAGIQPGGGATVIQDASPAKRPALIPSFLVSGMVGMTAAIILTAFLLVILGRRDRRLHYRDEFADAVGSAVIASVRSRVPRSVAGWSSLLESYAPGTIDAWALRQALRQLVSVESGGSPRRTHEQGRMQHPSSITVITLSDDLQGLAIGPQLASYAAASGIRTRLVPAQRHETAAALWAACSQERGEKEVRPGLVVGTNRPSKDDDVELTVVLAVVDRRKPELLDLPKDSPTVLALASGSATAEELARAAVTADDASTQIDGIIVANPDNLDRTTGRLLQHERSQQVPLPTRLTGVTTPKAGRTNVSGLRRRPG